MKQHVQLFCPFTETFDRICGRSSAVLSVILSLTETSRCMVALLLQQPCSIFHTLIYFSISCKNLQAIGDTFTNGHLWYVM